jgi:hypothetical protein
MLVHAVYHGGASALAGLQTAQETGAMKWH